MGLEDTLEFGAIIITGADSSVSVINDSSPINVLSNSGQVIVAVFSRSPGGTIAFAPGAAVITIGKIITDAQNGQTISAGDILSVTGNAIAIIATVGGLMGTAPVTLPVGFVLGGLGALANTKYGSSLLEQIRNSILDFILDTGHAGSSNLGSNYDPLGNFIGDLQNFFNQAQTTASPLILDLDGNGVVDTISKAAGVHFDLDANKFAETTGWVGKNDGLLVLDKNGNGKIDDGTELFGNNTLLKNGTKAANGFAALAELDSNKDGKIDISDSAYTQLRLWKDSNSDGQVNLGELLTLKQAGVKSLNTGFTAQTQTDAKGNQHLQVGSYTYTDGSTRSMDDVWFATDTARTIDQSLVTVNTSIAALPQVQGFGNVHSLQQAMAQDTSGKLQSLVTQFGQTTDTKVRQGLMNELLYRWAGVQDVDPNSRAATQIYGNAIGDARKLATLEAFLGQGYLGTWCWGTRDPNPHGLAAPILLRAFDLLSSYVYSQLMQQTQYKPLFESINVNISDSGVTLNVTQVASILRTQYNANTEQGAVYLGEFAASLKTIGTFGTEVISSLRKLGNVNATGFDFLLATLGFNSLIGTAGNDSLYGSDSDDVIDGLAGNDNISAGDGNNAVKGGLGDDIITAKAGNDLIDGGDGNDNISAGDGNNTVKGGLGDDKIWTGVGNDSLDGGDGNDNISAGDGNNTVIGGLGNDIIWTGVGNDSLDGGDGNDNISPGDGNNTVIGGLGDDIIWAGVGNDSLDGGDGNDNIQGGAGTNNLQGGAGNDTITGAGTLTGGTGNDVLTGYNGTTDTFVFNVGDGADIISTYESTGIASDVLKFGTGITLANLKLERTGNDLIFKVGTNGDQVRVTNWYYGAYYQFAKLQFADGTLLTNAQVNQQSLIQTGTAGNDSLYGSASDDVIDGLAGNDYISAGDGNNTVKGGLGDDKIWTGVGNDSLDGGDGNDNISASDGNNTVIGGLGDDNIWAGVGNDSLDGGDGNDNISAGDGNNTVKGGLGDDNIWAGVGNDSLDGGDGNDNIQGGAGDDILTGSGGKDVLVGGLGSDRFDYRNLTDSLLANFDIISDFNAGTDNDLFLVSTPRTAFGNGGAVATLDTAGISAKLTTAFFAANATAKFTFGSRTFIAINDATAGFSASNDAIIEVTSLTGLLGLTNFTTA